MQPDEVVKLEKLASTIQLNCGPYNEQHKGINNLVASEKEALSEFMVKQASRKPLNEDEKSEFVRIKETMRPAIAYDKFHPGYDSLAP